MSNQAGESDCEKTKEQLIRELASLRQRVGELAEAESACRRAEQQLSRYRDRHEELVRERTLELQVANEQLARVNDELTHEILETLRDDDVDSVIRGMSARRVDVFVSEG